MYYSTNPLSSVIQKKSSSITLIKQTMQSKHTHSVIGDVPLESSSMVKSIPPIIRPFPNQYGRGKVPHIEDHLVILATIIEEEEDAEQVNIDDELIAFETASIDEVQDFEELDRMINDDDDHKSMYLEEG